MNNCKNPSILIKKGRVIDPGQNIDGVYSILIHDGLIYSMVDGLSPLPSIDKDNTLVIDASGKCVLPGLIDLHTHLREPGYEYKETIETGAKAAAAGGFTTIACMPNTNPVNDNAAVTGYIKEKAAKTGICVYPIGALTKGLAGTELAAFGEMKAAGVIGLSDDGKSVMDSGIMRRAMEYARMFDLPVISHCEDVTLSRDGIANEGFISTLKGMKGIPSVAEDVMVARDIILAHYTGCNLHIAHVSTAGSVAIIEDAKARGIPVTAEVTPHHLTLLEDRVSEFDTNTKVNPPLRSRKDVETLVKGLSDDVIDIIASDHAPHSVADKDTVFEEAPSGILGMETAFAVVYTYIVKKEKLTLSNLVRKMSTSPARIFGIEGGTLGVGTVADVTIVDLDTPFEVDATKFRSKSRNCPWHGETLYGKVLYTISKGKIAYPELS